MRWPAALVVAVLGAIVLVAALVYAPSNPTEPPPAPARLFPEFGQHLAAAARIEVSRGKQSVTLQRQDQRWGVAERDLYPAQPGKVRALLSALAEVRGDEAKTDQPANHAKLGVADPTPDNDSGVIRVLDEKGAVLAAIIVGHAEREAAPSRLSLGDDAARAFVRRPGDNQVWLADGAPTVDPDPTAWLVRDIVTLDAARVTSVTVTRGAETLAFKVADGKVTLTRPDPHPVLADVKLAEVPRGLDGLALEDVRKSGDAAAVATARYETAETGVTATLLGDGWARFHAVGKDADAVNARVTGWDYKLADWQVKGIAPTLESVQAPPPAPPVPPPPAAPSGQITPPAKPPAPAPAPAPAKPPTPPPASH